MQFSRRRDWDGHGIYRATHVSLSLTDSSAVLCFSMLQQEKRGALTAQLSGNNSFADPCTEETSAATTSTASVTDRSVRKQNLRRSDINFFLPSSNQHLLQCNMLGWRKRDRQTVLRRKIIWVVQPWERQLQQPPAVPLHRQFKVWSVIVQSSVEGSVQRQREVESCCFPFKSTLKHKAWKQERLFIR